MELKSSEFIVVNGERFIGTVNKKGLDHIGLLVHKAFNVSIPKEDGDEDWPGDDLAIGQDVHFVVTCLDITSGLPYIRGALSSK